MTPTNRETTIPSHLFRVVLLRRLRLDHPLSVRCCPCGRPLDPCGHNRAACAGRDTWAAYALESIVARICREAGGRVRTNMMVRVDVPAPLARDSRRLEIVVDGLPVRGGAQVAVDTTSVCALHRHGVPRRGAAQWCRTSDRSEEERDHIPLVVVVIEVGGRWSEKTRGFLSALAIVRGMMRKRAEQAWRWGGLWRAQWLCFVPVRFDPFPWWGWQRAPCTRGGRRPRICRVVSRVRRLHFCLF